MEKETLNNETQKDTSSPATTTNVDTKKEEVSGKRFNSTPNMLVAVVAVLVVMAGVQVFQTQQLLAAVANGSMKGAMQQTAQQGGAATTLPSQVGGCG